jgi:hypothetical protein
MTLETGVDWIRMQSSIYRNPKVLSLLTLPTGFQTAVVYWFSMGYAGENGCRGQIPKVGLPIIQGRPKDAQRLVEAGLWKVTQNGWEVHDWSNYQPTPEYIAKRSEAGRAGAKARWAKRTGTAPAEVIESDGDPPF